MTAALSVLWALLPLVSFGFAAPFSFLYAALRRRSRRIGVSAAVYGLAVTVMFVVSSSAPDESQFWDSVFGTTMLSVMGVGTAHACLIRRRVFGLAARADRSLEGAFAAAKARRKLRERARALAAKDPSLAREIRIGRPDLPHQYDDGGLVDVNHAPAAALASLPGMTPERVERILRVRGERGGFVSADEVVVFADLPPDLAREIADYAIFLP